MGVYDELVTKLAKTAHGVRLRRSPIQKRLKDKARELLERATEMNPMYRELIEQILSI